MYKRVQVSIDDNSLSIINEFCSANKLTRSRFLERAALDYINAKKVEPELKNLLDQWGAKLEDLLKNSGSKSLT